MKVTFPSTYITFSGILLVLVIALMVVTESNPIGLSKNALTRAQKVEEIMNLPGQMARADQGNFLNFDRGILKKVTTSKKVLWQEDLSEKQLLWMGPEGIVVAEAKDIELLDLSGQPIFLKKDFLENPRVLDFQGDFLLLSGNLRQREYAALLNKKGTVIWLLPWEQHIISGCTSENGIYSTLNLIDEKLAGISKLVNSTGSVLWEIKRPVMIFISKVLPDGVELVAEDRIFKVDFDGRTVFEQTFSEPIFRADIGHDGYIAAIVRKKEGKLNPQEHPEIFMLNPEGKILWSYVLDEDPLGVKKADECIYIVYDNKILVLSKEGLLMASVNIEKIKGIDTVDSSQIIINSGEQSHLISISGG